MEWMLMPLRRYAEFSGRSQRKEYWMFSLGILIAYALLFGLLSIGLLGGKEDAGAGMFSGAFMIIIMIFVVGIFIPSLAVQVRRFHDQDKSGWFILLNLIPYLGGIIVLVMMCLDGTPGPNRYGPDPKGRIDAEVFA
jgi:uncharacterized membrane protein YhaH (DUF805 family)